MANNTATLAERWQFMMDFVNGVMGMHQKRLGHLDLKPHNACIRATGSARHEWQRRTDQVLDIIDLGHTTQLRDATATVPGPRGTPYYMPPEALGAQPRVGQPADVFALALCLFQIWLWEAKRMPYKYAGYDALRDLLKNEKRECASGTCPSTAYSLCSQHTALSFVVNSVIVNACLRHDSCCPWCCNVLKSSEPADRTLMQAHACVCAGVLRRNGPAFCSTCQNVCQPSWWTSSVTASCSTRQNAHLCGRSGTACLKLDSIWSATANWSPKENMRLAMAPVAAGSGHNEVVSRHIRAQCTARSRSAVVCVHCLHCTYIAPCSEVSHASVLPASVHQYITTLSTNVFVLLLHHPFTFTLRIVCEVRQSYQSGHKARCEPTATCPLWPLVTTGHISRVRHGLSHSWLRCMLACMALLAHLWPCV